MKTRTIKTNGLIFSKHIKSIEQYFEELDGVKVCVEHIAMGFVKVRGIHPIPDDQWDIIEKELICLLKKNIDG